MRKLIAAVIVAGLFATGSAHAQVGSLIWQDNFDNLSNWLKVTGNGSWGWGNGEPSTTATRTWTSRRCRASRATMRSGSSPATRAGRGSWTSGATR
ncbi:MAG: hypothetical protein IPJ04_09965 [Candidatus Eisenbacteria bacterium]|nr:hypothetical protein [Candidatus Eisenbacteria bacterium]